MAAWARTWWRCVWTMCWLRVQSRSSFSTISPVAAWMSTLLPQSSVALPKLVKWLDVLCSVRTIMGVLHFCHLSHLSLPLQVVRQQKCQVFTVRGSTIWPGSVSEQWNVELSCLGSVTSRKETYWLVSPPLGSTVMASAWSGKSWREPTSATAPLLLLAHQHRPLVSHHYRIQVEFILIIHKYFETNFSSIWLESHLLKSSQILPLIFIPLSL